MHLEIHRVYTCENKLPLINIDQNNKLASHIYIFIPNDRLFKAQTLHSFIKQMEIIFTFKLNGHKL
ncbi:hypothetical protein C6H66_01755 [Photorhabdus hindustanensis]|uniref:Uncharacterized protein n=1 Tax=Photorhabdus hindustanensis TaxID=2918802 RepID=A0A2S8Q8K8_9GAMM|nr:hypothetical protein C6H66_01755 [Photorhabdus hindustanensis]